MTINYQSERSTPKLALDLYRPEGKGPFPILILIHGGGWVSGSREQMKPHSDQLVADGWAVASIDYRLAPSNLWPAQREDAESALNYLVQHAKSLHLAADQVAAAGESAGAHLSLWLAVHGPNQGRIKAVGLISPLIDLAIPMTAEGESFQIVQKTIGTSDPTKIRDFSPVNYISKATPPAYFLHGEKDPWVPKAHVEEPAKVFRRLQIPIQIDYVPDMGHGLTLSHEPESAALDRFSKWAMALVKPR